MKTSVRRWEKQDDRPDPPYRHKGCDGVAAFDDDRAVCRGCGQVWELTAKGWVPK